MIKKFRIIHYKDGFAVQSYLPPHEETYRPWLFGKKKTRTIEESWVPVTEDQPTTISGGTAIVYTYKTRVFETVEKAENYIKSLRREVVKEIEYE